METEVTSQMQHWIYITDHSKSPK